MANKFIAALFAAVLPTIAAPLAASAQDVPPSYVAPDDAGAHDQQIRGRIVAFDGQFNLQVRDENGYVDNVELHQGTIINPTGLTLEPGMVVSILGYNGGGAFDANEIDTPYSYDTGVAYYEGHPWSYWGPSVSLGFFFGNAGWWQPHYTAFFGGGPFVAGFGYGYRGGYYGHPVYYGHGYAPGYRSGVGVGVNVNVNTYNHSTYNGSGYHGNYNGGASNGYHGSPNAGYNGYNGYHGTPGATNYRTTSSYRNSAPQSGYRAPSSSSYHGGGDHGGGDHHR